MRTALEYQSDRIQAWVRPVLGLILCFHNNTAHDLSTTWGITVTLCPLRLYYDLRLSQLVLAVRLVL